MGYHGHVDEGYRAERVETHMTTNYEGMSVSQYMGTRVSSLKPPMTKLPNPISLLRSLNAQQWAFFFVAFAAWVSLSFLVYRSTRRTNVIKTTDLGRFRLLHRFAHRFRSRYGLQEKSC